MQVERERSKKKGPKTTPKHNIVVVRAALQENTDMDEDLFRLKVSFQIVYLLYTFFVICQCTY